MAKGLVSILIPCYNAEEYLDECLSAILNQTYNNIEVVIVNDGSTDRSEAIIDSYVEKFSKTEKKIIKLNQTNQGQAAACNNGLKHLTGDYLYWQDADDVLELDAIALLVDFLEDKKEYDLVRGNVAFRKKEQFNKIENIGKPDNPNASNIFENYLFERNSYCFAGIFMVRMSYFDKCNPQRELYISDGGQNYQILLPIIYEGNCGYINKVVYNCRISSDSHSHSVVKLKDKIRRCNEQKKIVLNTLSRIESMSSKKLITYIFKIRLKYMKRKIRCILSSILSNRIKKNIRRCINARNSRKK